jgi:hypothetical protein
VHFLVCLFKLENMEMGRDRRIESQTDDANAIRFLRLRVRGQLDPSLGDGIADNVIEFILLVAAAEYEAIAGVQLVDVAVLGQEREGGDDGQMWAGSGDIGELASDPGEAVAVVAPVEEAREGLGQLLAMVRVGDEVAPGLGDAPEAMDGPDREAGEDIHDKVVREAGRRVGRQLFGALLLHGAEGIRGRPVNPAMRYYWPIWSERKGAPCNRENERE